MINVRDCYGPFNKNLIRLIHVAYLCNRRDMEILALQDKIKIVIRNTELELIKIAAPKLLEYSEQIKNKDETFFIEGDFEEEIKGQDAVEPDEVTKMINKLKQYYSTMSEIEKEDVWIMINNMVDACYKYTEYLQQ